MQTKEQWATVLKNLRETDPAVHSVVANIPVAFTHELIILNINNRAKMELVNEYRTKLPENIELRLIEKGNAPMTIEQKLEKLFGDKVKIE